MSQWGEVQGEPVSSGVLERMAACSHSVLGMEQKTAQARETCKPSHTQSQSAYFVNDNDDICIPAMYATLDDIQ